MNTPRYNFLWDFEDTERDALLVGHIRIKQIILKFPYIATLSPKVI